jgi:iron complex outermembrane recepter protein
VVHHSADQDPTGGVNPTFCSTPVSGILPCASDQLNGYHKYGEVSSVSQTSPYGVFTAGIWYEWASTNRYLYPTNPFTRAFGSLPSYREYFTTSSYQPFVEYSYRAIPRLTVTGGFKYAYYTQDFTQYPDNGKTIGTPPAGASSVFNHAGYNSPLPDASANYRILPNWSAYAQFAQGSVIPPSSVFDVKTGAVETLPKPARTTAYQAGTVLKLKRVMFDGDVYHIKFQNAYTSFTPPNGAPIYFLNPDSITIGGELRLTSPSLAASVFTPTEASATPSTLAPVFPLASGWRTLPPTPRASDSPTSSATSTLASSRSALVPCGTTTSLTTTRLRSTPSRW